MYSENFKKRLFSSTWRISVAQGMIHMKLHVACFNTCNTKHTTIVCTGGSSGGGCGLRGLQPPLNFPKNIGHPRGRCDRFTGVAVMIDLVQCYFIKQCGFVCVE